MNKVIHLRPAQSPDAVLEAAVGHFDNVLIIGFGPDGELDARADLGTTKEQALWLASAFINNLLSGEYNE